MVKSFAVFGLGQFGGTLVKEFHSMGIEVIAIDRDENKVNEFSPFATYAVCTQSLDENLLKELGIKNVDHAFVSFGDDLEASILTSLMLKDIGVNKVWTKSQSVHHTTVLKKIGVDRVIQPSFDVAKKIARHIISDKMIDFIELSDTYSMVEIAATPKINQITIGDLDIRARFGCTVVGVQRDDAFVISPPIDEMINTGDVLIIIGHNADIDRFEKEGI
ncbi:potassium channel family protein [Salinicoccus roseus]|uniref:Potassium transporter Trk n=1 Tax=Salinicoccus roseus TaxID=45670 RepID=A0A0C2H804_9STAP|nr:TrkA family potassium uptake protein [Salinicoccus roseus]KIH69955.1 potassium transporter Trk [Salinicoccus roseus]MDB0581254.1 TrkA family potassium uptake protein [Salinicoccus roseus]